MRNSILALATLLSQLTATNSFTLLSKHTMAAATSSTSSSGVLFVPADRTAADILLTHNYHRTALDGGQG